MFRNSNGPMPPAGREGSGGEGGGNGGGGGGDVMDGWDVQLGDGAACVSPEKREMFQARLEEILKSPINVSAVIEDVTGAVCV
jgi:hypothetical protein